MSVCVDGCLQREFAADEVFVDGQFISIRCVLSFTVIVKGKYLA